MAKGLFTQGMCVLLREPVSAESVRERLSEFNWVRDHESESDDDAPLTLVYEYDPDSDGHLLVTPSTEPWPDDLGDPETTPERFIAWSLGQYGPLAFPGCLRRAGEQSWGWPDGPQKIDGHRCHIRLLVSYILGNGDTEDGVADDSPLLPDDYNPLEELQFLTRAVESLLQLPEAIGYFNPGGEVLRDGDGLRQGLNHAWNFEMPPLEMWTNVRLFQASGGWTLMDTVGNGQLDLPDVEAVYPADKFEPSDVERFLRSASLYLMQNEDEVADGDTADGPGDQTWSAIECADGLSDPPRETIRWVPADADDVPPELLDPGLEEDEQFDEDALDADTPHDPDLDCDLEAE